MRPPAQSLGDNGASSRSLLSLNKITIRIISTVKCYFQLYSPKNKEFRTICQLATCDDRRPSHVALAMSLELSPYTIITHSLERRDEAHFWLNGYVNKQNCRIWSEANPQVYVETPFHPEKLTVWCALWAGGIIDPYFFKNDEGHNGFVKSLVYADKPQTLDHLEDNIRRVIADIWPQMLEKVIENWTSRLDYIRASRGSHMPEILFKM
ncbi:putative DD41D transposase [Trichonephila clavipes]|nr:putative DD41D transposase [Trichonephila clavipes]